MTVPDRVIVRPTKLARICWGLAVFVLIAFALVAVALGSGEPGEMTFRLTDQIAMFGLGVLTAVGLVGFTRARVDADRDGIRVRTVLSEKVLPWQVVHSVRMDDGSPWASLELQDDDTVALFAVQSNDGEKAVQAVLDLRALLRASRT